MEDESKYTKILKYITKCMNEICKKSGNHICSETEFIFINRPKYCTIVVRDKKMSLEDTINDAISAKIYYAATPSEYFNHLKCLCKKDFVLDDLYDLIMTPIDVLIVKAELNDVE